MHVTNHSPFAASHLIAWDRDGQEVLVVIVKCTYAFEPDGRLVTAGEQSPVSRGDEFEPGQPLKLKRPGDFNTGKPGTDILVQGSAWTAHGEPMTVMPLSLRVGPISISARVWGERWNENSLLGWRLSSPQPFVRLPLTWETAFGGADPDPSKSVFWPENPIGRGFLAGRPSSREPVAAPNLEWADSPYRGFSEPARTLGFGPVHPAWSPRRQHAGTYDDRWREERAPFVPGDFDPRFFHVAPPYLRTAVPLKGGEDVMWKGFHPEVPTAFQLPRPSHDVVYRQRGLKSDLDAVWLMPDEKRVSMAWRTLLPLPRSASTSVEVSIQGKPRVRLGQVS
ncbi:DUF2169 domain-containing protein [Corallococcus sp. CA047B]|uniref:DUF2169 family type VI secretion system accessory protein n=1 Tax=Corallococcus sp. CA047B TaxID=2316729 RepID=UPI000EA1BCF7|nr:DUF2169 domain-containing protein [Corallococcus sp. CA047B]RKH19233.1 DUF2169 domain-containing protein [Corallococcus sp. CA047B]